MEMRTWAEAITLGANHSPQTQKSHTAMASFGACESVKWFQREWLWRLMCLRSRCGGMPTGRQQMPYPHPHHQGPKSRHHPAPVTVHLKRGDVGSLTCSNRSETTSRESSV